MSEIDEIVGQIKRIHVLENKVNDKLYDFLIKSLIRIEWYDWEINIIRCGQARCTLYLETSDLKVTRVQVFKINDVFIYDTPTLKQQIETINKQAAEWAMILGSG